MSRRRMSLQDACELVPDDLPDGAYWAMAHEIAGAEYGDAWHELDSFKQKGTPKPAKINCRICGKKCGGEQGLAAHFRDVHKVTA